MPADALTQIIGIFPGNLECVVFVREKHSVTPAVQDGEEASASSLGDGEVVMLDLIEYHLHAYVCFKEKFRTRNHRVWDLKDLQASTLLYHPNVQAVKNRSNVLEYLMKEKPEGSDIATYPADLNVGMLISGKGSSAMQIIAQRLLKGDPVRAVVAEYPGIALRILDKMQAFSNFGRAVDRSLPGVVKRFYVDESDQVNNVPCIEDYELANWLNLRLLMQDRRTYSRVVGERTVHNSCFVLAKPGAGKTRLLEQIERCIPTCRLINDFRFYGDNYDDDVHELIAFDEAGSDNNNPSKRVLFQVMGAEKCSLKKHNGFVNKSAALPVLLLGYIDPLLKLLGKEPTEDDRVAFNRRCKMISFHQQSDIRVRLSDAVLEDGTIPIYDIYDLGAKGVRPAMFMQQRY